MKKEYQLILQNENIKKADYVASMKKYFLDYAMSVLIGRALPDVRDGLKPVHRRILYAMSELKLVPEKGYRKCARIVGDVLGKYHPHGDSSVYEALVRMAQDFSMRYVLVDGHGNFGSIDGDSASAMRYTEAKMDKMSMEMLRDINKNTVNFMPNFDGEEQEPVVLPSRFPNLLVNGSSGIAVGFATEIPPHNLVDVIEQIIYQIDNPDTTIEELVNILKAPDFSTGGYIVNPKEMLEMYTNGRGKVIMRGKYHVEDGNKIVFTEIPYRVNKTALMINLIRLKDGYIKKIKDGNKIIDVPVKAKIPQIMALHDLSDGKTGIRIEITIDHESNVEKVLKLLFVHSDLQCNFNSIFTAVKDEKLFRELSLKEINSFYIEYQKEVISRRTQFDLDKALARQHILEGFVKALDNVDLTINVIRASKNKSEAIEQLMEKLQISTKQAEAIVEMKLRRLTGMEIAEINTELNDITNQVIYLESILNDEKILLSVLKDELNEIKLKYGDDRKSEILYEDSLETIDVKEIQIEDYNCRIFYTNNYIKKHLKQSDNHKYVEGNTVLGDITTTNKSTLIIFTNQGNRYRIQCSDLEQYQPSAHGTFAPNLLKFESGEEIIKIVSVENPVGYMVFAFENGNVAKVKIDKFMSNYSRLKNCYATGSRLLDIYYSEKDIDILMVSDEGKGIIFNTGTINAVGSMNSQGNVGMKLEDEFIVIGAIMDVNKDINFELTTQKGKVKDFLLYDIAPTNKPNEERNLFTYLFKKRGNLGNFLINTRSNNDRVTELKRI